MKNHLHSSGTKHLFWQLPRELVLAHYLISSAVQGTVGSRKLQEKISRHLLDSCLRISCVLLEPYIYDFLKEKLWFSENNYSKLAKNNRKLRLV